jgi:N6-L-threonylcarbamoyladenine synthase
VPELASREHLRAIVPVVRAALEQAGVGFKDLDAVAVTAGPGLAGALLVGITYAKALAYANRLPLIAVNHLEGHIHAVLLREREERDALRSEEPALALVVSGGHTHLYLARPSGRLWSYKLIGRTVDDAAGEAYDKVAKLLGLGYPGGPWIDALAQFGDPNGVPFSFSQVKAKAHLRGKTARTKGAETSPIADLDSHFLFSFSGIKTAVLRYVELSGLRDEAERRADRLYPSRAEGDGRGTYGAVKPAQTKDEALGLCTQGTLDLIASFQHAVIGDLMKKTFGAAERLGAGRILVTGGVAANRELRERFSHEAGTRGLEISFPTKELSTDNAAMIAAAAWPRFEAGEFAPADLSADPALKLA